MSCLVLVRYSICTCCIHTQVDAAIEASSLIDKEIDGIVDAVEEQYGTRSFVSVHVRTEGDWVAYCLAMDRQDLSTSCFVDDKEIGKFLREDEKLPRYVHGW